MSNNKSKKKNDKYEIAPFNKNPAERRGGDFYSWCGL